MVDKARLEYVWLDGSGEKIHGGRQEIINGYVMSRLRGKWNFMSKKSGVEPVLWTGEEEKEGFPVPWWSMDGSSTFQGKTEDSDRLLKPVKVVRNPLVTSPEFESYLVLCEVMNRDETPHKTNTRHNLVTLLNKIKEEHDDDTKDWASFEQEYTLFKDENRLLPFGWSENPKNWPREGMHYCRASEATRFGLHIANTHAEACLSAGLDIKGGNAEVMPSQFEYQSFPIGLLELADQTWIKRWILEGVAAQNGAYASFHPKPTEWMLSKMSDDDKAALLARLKESWGTEELNEFVMNGAGAHLNWSNSKIREGSPKYKEQIIQQLIKQENHNFLMSRYGDGNKLRMTGKCETANYEEGTYGDVNRGASLRCPEIVSGGKDRLEDRRVAANHDPYTSLFGFATAIYFPENISGDSEHRERKGLELAVS